MLQEVINDKDGKRVWHERVLATSSMESAEGVIVWLGSLKSIKELPEYLREYKSHLTDTFYSLVEEQGLFFNRLRIGRTDGGQLTHIPTSFYWLEAEKSFTGMLSLPRINSVLNSANRERGCGNYWVGMATYPLPKDWYRPDSFWPGWTHLFHSDQYGQASAAFDYVAEYIYTTGYYPQDLKLLTRELANNLGIDLTKRDWFGFGKEKLYWQLPWLNPKLTHHPLTGDILPETSKSGL